MSLPRAVPPSGPLRQLAALLTLRWQMARAPGVRLGLCLTAVFVLWLLVQAVRVGRSLDVATLGTALEVAPAAYVGFGVLALVAPLTAGGGQDVVPPDELVALPVRPATQFLGGLLLAPLNLVWIVQLLGLALLTSCLTVDGDLPRGAATTAAYVLAVTALGQALAWTVVGLRRTRAGRRVVGIAGVLGLAAGVLAVRTGTAGAVQRLSARTVVDGVIAGGDGHLQRWGVVTAGLLAVAVAALAGGAVACRWSLLRPGEPGGQTTHGPVRRRTARRGPLRELVAVDRASVWRAPALRRGAVVLAVLPGLLAAGAALPWSSLVVLPALVAAGAGLLFGVNAFSLDASGSVWLASLPSDPALVLRSKALVLTETVLAAVTVAVVAGSVRSPGSPTPTELAAIASSVLLCTAVVVVLSLHASLRRPFRADLRGPRDAVAPPGALALASLRLALPTALVGVILGTAAGTGLWWLPPALALPALGLCALSAARTARRWSDPVHRSFVVHSVANG
jgi:hypothetical protein